MADPLQNPLFRALFLGEALPQQAQRRQPTGIYTIPQSLTEAVEKRKGTIRNQDEYLQNLLERMGESIGRTRQTLGLNKPWDTKYKKKPPTKRTSFKESIDAIVGSAGKPPAEVSRAAKKHQDFLALTGYFGKKWEDMTLKERAYRKARQLGDWLDETGFNAWLRRQGYLDN